MTNDAKHDKHVEHIYQNHLIKKNQVAEPIKSDRTSQLEQTSLFGRLDMCFRVIAQILEDPKIPMKFRDEVLREFTNTINSVVMHSDPDVISTLIMEELQKKNLEKIKKS